MVGDVPASVCAGTDVLLEDVLGSPHHTSRPKGARMQSHWAANPVAPLPSGTEMGQRLWDRISPNWSSGTVEAMGNYRNLIRPPEYSQVEFQSDPPP